MHRFKAQGISSRHISVPKWVNPKDRIKQWNIVKGDKVGYSIQEVTFDMAPNKTVQVAIIAGKDKDTIGEIKAVNRQNNTVLVEGKKLASDTKSI